MLYCIEVKKEFAEEDCVLHHRFDAEPTRKEILQYVLSQDIGYNDNYGKLDFYLVTED